MSVGVLKTKRVRAQISDPDGRTKMRHLGGKTNLTNPADVREHFKLLRTCSLIWKCFSNSYYIKVHVFCS